MGGKEEGKSEAGAFLMIWEAALLACPMCCCRWTGQRHSVGACARTRLFANDAQGSRKVVSKMERSRWLVHSIYMAVVWSVMHLVQIAGLRRNP